MIQLDYDPEELPQLALIFNAKRAEGLDVSEALEAVFLAMTGELPKEIEEAQRQLYERQIGPPPIDYGERLRAAFDFKYGVTDGFSIPTLTIRSTGSGSSEPPSQGTEGTAGIARQEDLHPEG